MGISDSPIIIILSSLFKMNIESLEVKVIVERIDFIRLGPLVLAIGISDGPIIIILSSLFKMNIESLEVKVGRIDFIRLGALVLAIGISNGPIIEFFHPFSK